MKYKVKITSWIYVNADDIFEAEDKATESIRAEDFEVEKVEADECPTDNDDMKFERFRDEKQHSQEGYL